MNLNEKEKKVKEYYDKNSEEWSALRSDKSFYKDEIEELVKLIPKNSKNT